MNIFTTIKRIAEPEPKSILEQTPFPCGFFDFGKAKKSGADFFNCGLVERPDGTWLVTRRARNWIDKLGFNDVVAFKLKDKVPQFGVPIKFRRAFMDQHYEDPRAIYHDGHTYVSCTSFLILSHNRWTKAHQTLSVVNDKWVALAQMSPKYGFNGNMVMSNKGMEKNWLWFFHYDQLHMVYQTSPHTVVVFSQNKPVEQHVTKEINPDWTFGAPRGGTPPIRVGDEYWSFFHSSVPWINQKRRYFMGAYAFHAYPPFAMSRMSSTPILTGSRHDPWDAKKPACVFPCGSVFKDGTWTITGGCNDLLSFWIEIPHDALAEMTDGL